MNAVLSHYDHLVVAGTDFLTNEVGQSDPIIDGIIPSAGIAIAAADKGAGKTWLGDDLILSVAHGQPFVGHYPVQRKGRVLVIVTEGSRSGWKARLRSQAAGKGIDSNHALDGVDVIFRRSVYLDDPGFVDWLVMRASGFVLIVVDVLRDAWTGDENSTADAARLVRGLRAITNQGATVMLLHHTGKPGLRPRSLRHQVRGSSVLVDAADSLMYLVRATTGRVKVSMESRDDIPAQPFTFAIPASRVDGIEPVDLDWQTCSSSGSRDTDPDPDTGEADPLADIKALILQKLTGAPDGLSGYAIRKDGRNPNRTLAALRGLARSGLVNVTDGPHGANLYRLTASAPVDVYRPVSPPSIGGDEYRSEVQVEPVELTCTGYTSSTGAVHVDTGPSATDDSELENQPTPFLVAENPLSAKRQAHAAVDDVRPTNCSSCRSSNIASLADGAWHCLACLKYFEVAS